MHRAKGKASDLVTTTVWGWEGRHSQCGERERKKLSELASRFGTKLVNAPQGKEPFEMVQVLGGTVVIRHGSRAHWTTENTALYCVRMHGHHYVVIEEVELVRTSYITLFFLLTVAAGIGQSLLCVQLLPHGARCPLHLAWERLYNG